MEMKGITEQEFNSLISKENILIVDFFAKWCGPCQMYYGVFDKVSQQSKYKMVKIDVDENPDLAQKADVEGIPSTVVYKNGNIINKTSGFMSETQLIAFINSVK